MGCVEYRDPGRARSNRRTAFWNACQRSDDESDRIVGSMGLLSGERNQGRGARRENVPRWGCFRRRWKKGRAISGRTKRDSGKSQRETKRSEIKLSLARTFHATSDY